MIDLVLGLHLYQPPDQDLEVIKKITLESYLPMADLILSHPRAFFAVDIARSAIENLGKLKESKLFLAKIKTASEIRKIYLTNTAAYHPILPLLPEEEITRQILLNEKSYKSLFGKDFPSKSNGIFPPEMAYSEKLIPVFEKLNYQWTITADTPFNCQYNQDSPYDWIPKQGRIAIFLRSNLWSNRIAFESLPPNVFVSNLKNDLKKWFKGNRGYLILWMDWETFGHHRPNLTESFLAPFLDHLNGEINLVSPPDLLSKYPQKEIIIPQGTWSTTKDDFRNRNYWPLWKNPNVEFHKLWWELAEIILEIKKKIDSEKTLALFDKALYSCQTWQFCRGRRNLAIKGIEYFKKIMNLEETGSNREKIKEIIEQISHSG